MATSTNPSVKLQNLYNATREALTQVSVCHKKYDDAKIKFYTLKIKDLEYRKKLIEQGVYAEYNLTGILPTEKSVNLALKDAKQNLQKLKR